MHCYWCKCNHSHSKPLQIITMSIIPRCWCHVAKYYNTKYFCPGSDVLWPQLPNQQRRVSFLQREHHFWSNAYCLRAQVLFWTFLLPFCFPSFPASLVVSVFPASCLSFILFFSAFNAFFICLSFLCLFCPCPRRPPPLPPTQK